MRSEHHLQININHTKLFILKDGDNNGGFRREVAPTTGIVQ